MLISNRYTQLRDKIYQTFHILGTPLPSQETNAIDAVMQFAIIRLGFTPAEIIIHGWSIGGFPASWVAMNYPDIKAVVRIKSYS